MKQESICQAEGGPDCLSEDEPDQQVQNGTRVQVT